MCHCNVANRVVEMGYRVKSRLALLPGRHKAVPQAGKRCLRLTVVRNLAPYLRSDIKARELAVALHLAAVTDCGVGDLHPAVLGNLPGKLRILGNAGKEPEECDVFLRIHVSQNKAHHSVTFLAHQRSLLLSEVAPHNDFRNLRPLARPGEIQESLGI